MARTAMNIRQIPESYSGTTLDVSTLDAFDQPNGMSAPATGRILFRIKNPTAGAITITVASSTVAGRIDTAFTAKSLAAGADVVLPVFKPVGWQQASDALLHFDASATGLTYIASSLPPDA